MAIEKKLLKTENLFFVDFSNMYVRIDDVRMSIKHDEIEISVKGYINEESRLKEKNDNTFVAGIYKEIFQFKLTENIAAIQKIIKEEKVDFSEALIKFSYYYLLTLDNFKNSKNI